jgi:hypothetical protein
VSAYLAEMALIFLSALYFVSYVLGIGPDAIISFTGGALQLVDGSSVPSLFLSSADFLAVIRAGQSLLTDFGRVTWKNLTVATQDQTFLI